MKHSKTCDNKQLNLFSPTEISSSKAVLLPIFISEKMKQRRIEQMEKFKPLRQTVKPMIELSVESRLAEIDKRIPEAHLVRFIQAAVFKLDTSQIFLYGAETLSPEINVEFIILWLCHRIKK